jgi:hypothetical protein
MWQAIINMLLGWLYGETAKTLITSAISDVACAGKDLTLEAIKLVKDANDQNMDNKFDYVQEKLSEKFVEVGKSTLNSVIELAVTSVKNGLS